MKTSDIRESFLRFFEDKQHRIVSSSSLVPAGDPTLLFVNAGMVPFKDCFLGLEKRDYARATSCQKCIRISGKHNDLENVGRTARHHTFFEMLGNFSFGDYFKRDAIVFAWEFLTECLELPKERLWITVFETDDEAAKLWAEETDVLPGRILRLGEKDNFWAMGETGPCGPCSEIHYFLGEDLSSQSEEDFRREDGSYLEIWNLVFMQFNRDASGTMEPLPKPSVDTGMGLERIAAVKEGVLANYDTDELRRLIAFTETLSGHKYLGVDYTERDPEQDQQYAADVAFRVIADHTRAISFLIAEGVLPASDGRGYVLRRLIRRAARHGRVLGFEKSFLYQVAEELVSILSSAYPELIQALPQIKEQLILEEEKFATTLDTGISLLEKEVESLKKANKRQLPGATAFLLHDTYGFPLDMTEDIVRTKGLHVDQHGFYEAMERQRERSRNARASEVELMLQRSIKPEKTTFVGYEFTEYESELFAIYDDKGSRERAEIGEQLAFVARSTPFYPEQGGQVGDTGSLSGVNGVADVVDTRKVGPETIVHIAEVKEGFFGLGDKIRLEVEGVRRSEIALHHSATHLLHLALREVLGDHVQQAGSRVSEQSLRFDFSHPKALTEAELEAIEALVNREIRANTGVVIEELPLDEAKKSGAMALFGEKYGSIVRVVQIGERSRELCGGTHVSRSGDLALCTIVSECSVSSGVRRIEAVAGNRAYLRIREQREILEKLSAALKSSEEALLDKVERLQKRSKEIEKQLEQMSQSSQTSNNARLVEEAKTLDNGTRVVASVIKAASPKQLRAMADDLRARLGTALIALGSVKDGKGILLTAVTDDVAEQYHAGKLMKEIASVAGGSGGGRADLAQAGGADPDKLEAALQRFEELIQ